MWKSGKKSDFMGILDVENFVEFMKTFSTQKLMRKFSHNFQQPFHSKLMLD